MFTPFGTAQDTIIMRSKVADFPQIPAITSRTESNFVDIFIRNRNLSDFEGLGSCLFVVSIHHGEKYTVSLKERRSTITRLNAAHLDSACVVSGYLWNII